MVSKLIRLVAPLVFVVACSKDDPPPDRTRANGPGAPVEQPATKDPTVQPAEQPALTNGVRGAPGMTVDTPDAGAATPGTTTPPQPTTPSNAPGTPGGTQVVPPQPAAGTTKP